MENSGGGSTGGKAAAKGCGCLVSIFGLPFVLIALFILILMWIMTSLMSCGTEAVLSEILGVELTPEEEAALKDALRGEATTYDRIGSYFRDEGCPEQAATAQAFYLLYRQDVLRRDDYLESLLYCFADGVRLRTIERVRERFAIAFDEEDFDLVIAYSRSTYLDTSTFRPEKNGADLANLAQLAAKEWRFWPGSYGQVMSFDKPYAADYSNPAVWQLLGFRTVDNLGLLRAYAWLDKDTGEIAASDTNAITTNYEDATAVFAKATEAFPIDELVTIGEPGMGVYDAATNALGIYIGDGAVIYADDATQTIVQEGVLDGNWSECFYFAGMDYDNQVPDEAQLHIVISSNYLSGSTGIRLELWGPESYSIPLYFTDGTCTVDLTVAAGAYHASIRDSVAEIPDAVYGAWRDFNVDGGGYYDIAYLLDRDVLGQNGNVAAWIRAVRWLPRNRVSGRPK